MSEIRKTNAEQKEVFEEIKANFAGDDSIPLDVRFYDLVFAHY